MRANIKWIYCGVCQYSNVSDFVALGVQIMDTQPVFFLSFYYVLSSTSSLQTEKMKTEKNVLLSAPFCAPPFHGFHDLSALQTSPLYSIGSQLLPLPFLWLCMLPLDFLQGVLLHLTEPYNHREVQMKQIHIYVLWAKYSVSPKFTY